MSFLFSLAMTIHIVTGALAAIIVMPALILMPKSHAHARLGRVAELMALIIAASGFAMLANPLFTSFWSTESVDLDYGSSNYGAYFEYMTYEPLFFLFLDVTLLYLVLTGAGTWKRLAGRTADGRVPLRPLDITLMILMAIFALGQVVIGIHDLPVDHGYAHSAIATGTIMTAFVVWDLFTIGARSAKVKHWWFHHALKVIVAWGGLFYAVILRWRVQDEWLGKDEAWLVLGWAVVVTVGLGAFGIALHHRRMRSTTPTS